MKKIVVFCFSYFVFYTKAFSEHVSPLFQAYFESRYEAVLSAQPQQQDPQDLLYHGMALLALGFQAKAKEYLREANLYFEKKKDERGKFASAIYLNALEEKEGKACPIFFRRAVKFFRQKRDLFMEGEAFYYKGLGELSRSSFKQAKQDLEAAGSCYQKAKSPKCVLKIQAALGELYFLKSEWEKARTCFLKIASQASDDKYFLSLGLRGLGEVDRASFHETKASMHFERSLKLAREIQNPFVEILSLQGQGDVLFFKGDHPGALTLYKQALKQAQIAQLPRMEVSLLRRMGEACRMSDYVEDAQKYFDASLSKARMLQDKRAEAWALLGQADVARITDVLDRAKRLYDLSYPIFVATSCKQGQAQNLRGKGTLLYSLGHYEQARKVLETSFRLCQDIGDHLTASRVLIWQGKVENALGHYGRARTSYEKGIAICHQIQDPWGEVQLLTYLGDLEKENEHPKEATLIYEKTIALAEKIGDRAKEAMAHQGLGVLCARDKNYGNAQLHFEKALMLFRSINHLSGQAYTLYYQGEAEEDTQQAMIFYKKSYKLSEECQDILLKIALWRAMGKRDAHQRKFQERTHAFEKAQALSEKIHNKKEQAKSLYDWAETLIDEKTFESIHRGIQKAESALKFFEELDDTLSQAKTWRMLEKGYKNQGNTKKSQDASKKAEKIEKFLCLKKK